ncbi:spore gernimation protein KB [Paenibacillus hemerocallicola]|uniref:Spore gernimation protein KB n=1 Tax=Paenibacillus hemerocallicola TaxID=1172614 RepID=A0A5C4TGS5_9BACL|nr:endospore germination permease [Paenibacillus hemerocallicola]TNJ67952.1 spore gernimation protein KB [Paenibacillus hemerocallicola]
MNNDVVNVRQFMQLVALFTIGSSILFIPLSSASSAKQDSWMAILAGMAVTLGLVWLYVRLARQAPGCTLVEMNRKWLGKWLGSIVSLLYIATTLFLGAPSLLFYMGEFMATQIMTQTPMPVLNALFMLVVVMGLKLGLGTLARAAEVLFPIFAALFVALALLASPEIKPEHLQPAFAIGAKPFLRAVVDYVGFSGMPLVFILMLHPSVVGDTPKAEKAFFLGSVIGGAFLLVITMVCISVLGVENTVQQAYPSYALAKKINVGNILSRMEVFMATLWIISLYFKMILYSYAGLRGIAQLLRIGNERLLVLPLGATMVVLSLIMYPDTAYRDWWDSKIWPTYIATFGFLIPVVLLLVAKLRGKGRASA